jgi:hypothetical protein
MIQNTEEMNIKARQSKCNKEKQILRYKVCHMGQNRNSKDCQGVPRSDGREITW